jgi:hypothetical protein
VTRWPPLGKWPLTVFGQNRLSAHTESWHGQAGGGNRLNRVGSPAALALHDHVEGSGCCRPRPSCAPCAPSQRGMLAQEHKHRRPPVTRPVQADDAESVTVAPDTIGPDEPGSTWNTCGM